MFDINLVIEELKKERSCFSSEIDFQFAFAWKVKELYKNCKIILEQFAVIENDEKTSYIDLIVECEGVMCPIEFKYLTTTFEHSHFKLKKQGAHNIRSYDVIKDVERIEKYCKQNSLKKGYVIVITNDSTYWRAHSIINSNNKSYDFNLGEGRSLSGSLKWRENTNTQKGKEKPLNIIGNYDLKWNDYSKIDVNNGVFKFLKFEISYMQNSGFKIKEQKKLFEYLNNLHEDLVTLTLQEIENIIESKLPSSAFDHFAYWNDQNRSCALNSWVKANYLAKLERKEKRVTFKKV